MKEAIDLDETCNVYDIPVSAVLSAQRQDRYGHVRGLDDSELADPEELARQIIRDEWGPVLELPVNGRQDGFRPNVDEDGVVFGAFGSVDFDRIRLGFDKAQYKADKLKEQLKDTILMLEMIRQRLPKKPVALILKYLRMGIIDLECIANFDAWQLGTFYLRARWLRKQITELEEDSWGRKQERARRFFASLG
jgi:hypothetical protein